MLQHWRMRRDPWWDDGTGARRTRTRQRVVAAAAFALAVTSCGITTAMWLRVLLPMVGGLPLG
jgi:hypothetical protein